MSLNEIRSPSFIIGSRHMGRSFLVSMYGYSSVLQKDVFGKMSDEHRKALKLVSECCSIPDESWTTLSELIEQNSDQKVMEILNHADDTGETYLERTFVQRSLASMEIAQNALSSILQQVEQLTDEQRYYVEIISENCQREIEIWKEVAEYYSWSL